VQRALFNVARDEALHQQKEHKVRKLLPKMSEFADVAKKSRVISRLQ
jgi:hypothetical protein